MQELKNTNQKYKLGKYTFIFPENVKFKTTECDSYSVVSFFIENDGNTYLGQIFGKYEVINNLHLGYRLCISNKDGWQDIPFKKETFTFLPPCITTLEDE